MAGKAWRSASTATATAATARSRSWEGVAGVGILAARVVAWGALLGATGILVRAEVGRPEVPPGVVAYTDLVYRRAGERRARLDVYVPDAPAPRGGRPAVLAIHGGGWRGGSKGPYGRMAASLVRRGYVVVAVDYLLSRPGAPSWPDNVEDVREAVRWLRRHARDYGVDPRRIAAMGASAGGHLAALLGTLPDGPVAPEGAAVGPSPSARVQAVIDFYGPSDLEALAGGRRKAGGAANVFLGGTPDDVPGRYDAASPVRHVSPDDPPMLLIHGDDDLLVPPDQSERLARALEAAGVPHRLIVIPGVRHGFGLRAGDRDLVPEILAFLDSAWNVGSQ